MQRKKDTVSGEDANQGFIKRNIIQPEESKEGKAKRKRTGLSDLSNVIRSKIIF